MTPELLTVLEEAKKLPVKQRRELAALLLKDLDRPSRTADVQAARAIVAETSGSMSGLGRATLIRLAGDEEYGGY